MISSVITAVEASSRCMFFCFYLLIIFLLWSDLIYVIRISKKKMLDFAENMVYISRLNRVGGRFGMPVDS